MSDQRARLAGILIFTLILSLLSGCWDQEELNKLAIVAGIGIDLADEPGKIQLTAQIVKAGEIKTPESGSSGGDSSKRVWVTRSTGETVFEALRGFAAQSSRRFYVPHNQVIVIGKDAAEAGVQPLLDLFVRDNEARRRVKVLVAEGKASEVLAAKPNLEPLSATELSNLVDNQVNTSQSPDITLQDFLAGMISKTTEPVAPVVRASESPESQLQLVGTAVFKENRLVGKLDKSETRGLLWIMGKVVSGVINVRVPGDKGLASLEVTRAKSRVIAELENGRAKIRVQISEEGSLGNEMTEEGTMNAELMSALNSAQAVAVEREIVGALTKARNLNADIFGFGDAVHRKYPREWKVLEPQWDALFPQLEVTVTVKTQLRQVGHIVRPAVRY